MNVHQKDIPLGVWISQLELLCFSHLLLCSFDEQPVQIRPSEVPMRMT